jgi:hypothetical protein
VEALARLRLALALLVDQAVVALIVLVVIQLVMPEIPHPPLHLKEMQVATEIMLLILILVVEAAVVLI